MNAKDLIEKIRRKDNTDDDWLQIEKEINDFLATNPPSEERVLFTPLGYAEMVGMICDGIQRKNNADSK